MFEKALELLNDIVPLLEKYGWDSLVIDALEWILQCFVKLKEEEKMLKLHFNLCEKRHEWISPPLNTLLKIAFECPQWIRIQSLEYSVSGIKMNFDLDLTVTECLSVECEIHFDYFKNKEFFYFSRYSLHH